MKRLILFIVAFSIWALNASAAPAASDEKGVRVTGIEVVHADNTVTIFFTLHTGVKVTPSNRSLVINPVLSNRENQIELPPIVIRGSRARVIDAREAMSSDWANPDQQPYYTTNGKSIDYMASFPYEYWMAGSDLIFNGVNAGRGKDTEVKIGLVADNLMGSGEQQEPYAPQITQQTRPQTSVEPQTPPATPQRPVSTPPAQQQQTQQVATAPSLPMSTSRSIGDELAARFSFVEPVSAFQRAHQASQIVIFDYNMPLNLGAGSNSNVQKQNDVERFIGMTREGALSIQFRQGSKVISREDNNRALVDLISVIRALEASPDCKITRVVVVGFSSPEGTLNENEKLSMERAAVAKEFITANSSIRPDMVNTYNGSVDWSKLRELVAQSDMADKYRILDIIDNTPVWDSSRNRGRLGDLMAVNGGNPYRYMLENFFPRLRQMGAYIKVYYENMR